MKSLVNFINESKKVTVAELESWAKDVVEKIKGGSNATFYHLLGDASCKTGKMYLVIGRSDAYDKDDICMKLAYNCDDLQYDFDSDWEMPYDEESGEVDDTCSTFDIKDVKYLYNHYKKHYAN